MYGIPFGKDCVFNPFESLESDLSASIYPNIPETTVFVFVFVFLQVSLFVNPECIISIESISL